VGERGQRAHGDDRREALGDPAHVTPEAAAPGAVAHVLASVRIGPPATVVRGGDLVADQAAVGVARLRRLHQPHPCPDQQRLERRDGDAHRARDLGIGHAAQLAHEQRRALLLGEAANVGDQPPQRIALLGLGDRVVVGRAQEDHDLRRRRTGPAQLIDAAVVGNAEQPCAQGEPLVARPQPGVGADEYVLERVLGVLTPREHLARVGEQPLVIALVDRAERLLVAGAKQRDQLVVRTKTKQRGPDRDPGPGECRRCLECGRFHLEPLVSV
jgi:hypothetical protein